MNFLKTYETNFCLVETLIAKQMEKLGEKMRTKNAAVHFSPLSSLYSLSHLHLKEAVS
jgi:hypothetical protein